MIRLVQFFPTLLLPACLARAAETSRPNVLLICIDELRPVLGCYGGAAKTPNLDRFAETADRVIQALKDHRHQPFFIAGGFYKPHLDGNSLVPLLKNSNLPWDRPAITGFLDMRKLDVYMSVRTEHYRYIRYGPGSEEFYHCRKDPHEWTNQIDNPEFQAEIKRHRAMLPDPAGPIPYKKRGGKKTKKNPPIKAF